MKLMDSTQPNTPDVQPELLETHGQDQTDTQELDNIIECILFCSVTPLSDHQIQTMVSDRAHLPQVRESLKRLEEKYTAKSSGLELQRFKHGVQLRTKPLYNPYLQSFLRKRPWKLSRQSSEVLAIVAYRQPIHRAAIDEIRGADSAHLVHTLVDKGLIRMTGRAEDLPGKPICYGTTPKFLEVFSLKTISDLPSMREIKEELPSTT